MFKFLVKVIRLPLVYWFKPYIFFITGLLCGELDHPVKWISVTCFILASLIIEYLRYDNRAFDYEEIELKTKYPEAC